MKYKNIQLFISTFFSSNHKYLILFIPLIISSFTHLFNPLGFPAIWVVEGQYMHRAMSLLSGEEITYTKSEIYPHPYDHPFFGQTILAGLLWLFGFPDSAIIQTNNDSFLDSIKNLYLIPKIIIGIFSIFDTFLIYKIGTYRYNNKIGFLASILFACMPITWMFRKIFLESLLLPLFLLSILFIVKNGKRNNNNDVNYSVISITKTTNFNYEYLFLFFSGVFLGLSILTKLIMFTMIPLLFYLVYSKYKNNKKLLILWFIPVILIPLIWPVSVYIHGDINLWFKDLLWQSDRNNNPDSAVAGNLLSSFLFLFKIDPLFIIFGLFAGMLFAVLKRDFFLLLWIIPIMIFLYFIDFSSFFHLMPIIPALCIASASLFVYLYKINNRSIGKRIMFPFILLILFSGFFITSSLIITDVNHYYFEIVSMFVRYVVSDDDISSSNDTRSSSVSTTSISTLVGEHWTRGVYWIPKYVYNTNLNYNVITNENNTVTLQSPIKTEKVVVLLDEKLNQTLYQNYIDGKNNLYDITKLYFQINNTNNIYNSSIFPYASMEYNKDLKAVQIRVN